MKSFPESYVFQLNCSKQSFRSRLILIKIGIIALGAFFKSFWTYFSSKKLKLGHSQNISMDRTFSLRVTIKQSRPLHISNQKVLFEELHKFNTNFCRPENWSIKRQTGGIKRISQKKTANFLTSLKFFM